jgi:hypothetical protein
MTPDVATHFLFGALMSSKQTAARYTVRCGVLKLALLPTQARFVTYTPQIKNINEEEIEIDIK